MKRNWIKQFIPAVLTLCFFSAIAVLQAAPDKLKPGAEAPQFSLKDVQTGEKVNLSAFKDKKIVIVHFWKSK